MDNEPKDDRDRAAASSIGQIERAAQSPVETPPAEDPGETHMHSEVVEIGPLRAEIAVRSETLERRIARLERRNPKGG